MNCPNCGKEVPDNANACGYCGQRLKPAVPLPIQPERIPISAWQDIQRPTPRARKSMPGWVWGILGVMITLILVGAVFFFLLPKLKSTASLGFAPKASPTPRTMIQPGRHGLVYNPLSSFGEIISDNKTLHQPGTVTWRVSPPPDQVWLYTGWTAKSETILNQNLPHLRWEIQVDGVKHPLSELFYEVQVASDGSVGANYSGRIVNLAAGEHTVIAKIAVDQAINDGWNDCPAGDYIIQYLITIQP